MRRVTVRARAAAVSPDWAGGTRLAEGINRFVAGHGRRGLAGARAGRAPLDLLRAAEARSEGFGAVRSARVPLPMCKVEVAPCYESRGDELGCRNPEFHELPRARPSFRVFAKISS